MPAGVGLGIAILRTRLPGLAAPVAALALCDPGGDFGGPDGEPAEINAPFPTPGDADTRRRVATARSFAELSRALRDAPVRAGED